MSSVAIRNSELKLFKTIMERGFVIGDGSKTDRIVRELKRANIKVHHGYAQSSKKVIVALEQSFTVKQKRRTSNKTLFELQRE